MFNIFNNSILIVEIYEISQVSMQQWQNKKLHEKKMN